MSIRDYCSEILEECGIEKKEQDMEFEDRKKEYVNVDTYRKRSIGVGYEWRSLHVTDITLLLKTYPEYVTIKNNNWIEIEVPRNMSFNIATLERFYCLPHSAPVFTKIGVGKDEYNIAMATMEANDNKYGEQQWCKK